jgi:pimeloyl-ACP methyl ester carboxylesterase
VPALAHREVLVQADGAMLRGWYFPGARPPSGATVVYLHGSADNRASGLWIAERMVRAGHDVLAYDSRAHGESSGDACTYGYREKRDLSRALDALGVSRAILVGGSLGAAVALQAAAEDPRILAVVAAATFSDLETVARERAPWFASEGQIREALAIAERQGEFEVAAVSATLAARRVRVPVLLVHGADDAETPPAHSERVFAALAGPKQLRIVEGAGHSDALGRVWPEVEAWIEAVASRDRAATGTARLP